MDFVVVFDCCLKFRMTQTITFQVMIQRHNRQMSISLYLAAVAVLDTLVLVKGKQLLSGSWKLIAFMSAK